MMYGKPRMTVAERAKMTGYVAGPNHPLLRDKERMMMEKGMTDGPPNLRPAEDDTQSCTYCTHFADGQCGKYQRPVRESEVCDSFEVEGEEEDGEFMPEGPGMDTGVGYPR